MSEPPLETFPSRPQLDSALAGAVAERLTAAIAARGRALLVVSGGATPLGLFRELAARELPWDRVQITLADERQRSEERRVGKARSSRRSRAECTHTDQA